MAMIGRKQPAAPPTPTPDRTKQRPAPAAAGSGGRFGKIRGNIQDIASELRKVTWPTREETRNLTIVVIGISATIGILLGGLDLLLSSLYGFLQ